MSEGDFKMPVLFIAHGSPMDVLDESGSAVRMWKKIAKSMPVPKHILCISAHWLTDESTLVTSEDRPKTIYDFYGFSQKLYKLTYKSPGCPQLAKQLEIMVGAKATNEWGYDHGCWTVLTHMYPEQNIPVIELSVAVSLSAARMFEMGVALEPLRKEGVLIMGSGGIIHNLRLLRPSAPPSFYPWALPFVQQVKRIISINQKRHNIARYKQIEGAKLAADGHFLPLLYVCGASAWDDAEFYGEEDGEGALSCGGSISMLSIVFRQKGPA